MRDGTPSPPASALGPLRVLLVAESFLPQVNGVTNSVCRVLEHLQARGHTATVVAPTGPDGYAGAEVHRVAGAGLPGYEGFTVGLAARRTLRRIMREFRPDVVHLASPFVLGHAALRAAHSLQIRTVSIYQTDVLGFARRYRLTAAEPILARRMRQIHRLTDLTLAPSSASMTQLAELGVPRVRCWTRGVDTVRFAPHRRSSALNRELGGGDVVVGYVGRLAREKDLQQLHALHGLPGIRLVLVGGGPDEPRLRALLPGARFLGPRHGTELAEIMASLDVFVHTGAEETFCQAVQEALASGVPAVGPAAGGLLERIDDDVSGLHYASGDEAGLRSAVAQLAGDGALRRRMGAAARAGVEGRSWESINDELIGHYLDVLSGQDDAGRLRGLAV